MLHELTKGAPWHRRTIGADKATTSESSSVIRATEIHAACRQI